MGANCLNKKNPEVAKLLQEYTDILGDADAAYYMVAMNDGLDLRGENKNSKEYQEALLNSSNAAEALIKLYNQQHPEDAVEINNNQGETVTRKLTKDDIIEKAKDFMSKSTETPKVLKETYNKLLNALKLRIKSFEHSVLNGTKTLDELNNLLFKLESLEELESIPEFVDNMLNDLKKAYRDIKSLQAKYDEWNEYKNGDCPISPKDLDLISKGTIGFYENLITNLQNLLDDKETAVLYDELGIKETMQNKLINSIAAYSEIQRIYQQVSNAVSKARIIDVAKKYNSFTVKELEEKLSEGDDDLNFWDRYIGNTQYSSSEIIRQTLSRLTEAKYRVHDKKLSVGKHLVSLLKKCKLSDVELFFERDEKGNRTGNFVTDLNFGMHERDYENHMLDFVKKLGVEIPADTFFNDISSILNREQQKKWNEEKLKWDSENSEMKFTPDYYRLLNILSDDALTLKQEIDREMNNILNPTRDAKGHSHKEKLSDEAYERLLILEARKKNLSNPYTLDGELKTGKEKQIAEEFAEYYKQLRDNIHYKADEKAWTEARAKAKRELSPEEFKKWDARNSVDEITEEFYEELAKLAKKSKSDTQISLEEKRQQLLRLYKLDKEVDPKQIPEKVRLMLKLLDKQIAAESKKNPEQSRVSEIAEWIVNPRFYQEMEFYKTKRPQQEYLMWLQNNTIGKIDGKVIPASFWRRMVPKDRTKYMRKAPNSSWVEIDPDSNFYNKNYDASYGVTRMPKRSKYDNTKNFNKIKGPAKDLYDALRKAMDDANSLIYFRHKQNKVLLPQVEGRLMDILRSRDSAMSKLSYTVSGTYQVRNTDEQYARNELEALNPDGTKVRLAPTRYMTRLDNPEHLTHDLVGAVIQYVGMAQNFSEMSKIAPEMEQTLEMVEQMKFKTKNGFNTGKASKTYAKLNELIERFVYGIEEENIEVEFGKGNKKHRVNLSKLANTLATYTRIVGMGNNIHVILTGLITNKEVSMLEAVAGMYYDKKTLLKAKLELQKAYVPALFGIGSADSKVKAILAMEYCGVGRTLEETFKNLDRNRVYRTLSSQSKMFFGGYEMADFMSKAPSIIAIYMSYKLDPSTGRFVNKMNFLSKYKNKKEGEAAWELLDTNLYDAFEVVGNEFKIKEQYKSNVDELMLTRMRNTCKQLGSKIDTTLSDLDKAYVSANAFTKLFTIYRNFLIINLQTKFITKRQFDYATGTWQEGQFRGALNYFYRHFVNPKLMESLKAHYQNYDDLDYFEKRLLVRSLCEITLAFGVMFLLCNLAMTIADRDRHDEMKQLLALIALRSKIELQTNVIPLEAMNLFKSPTAAWSLIENFIKFFKVFFDQPNRKITSGSYRGKTRLERSLIKLTPIRSIYEVGNSRDKMQYYSNLFNTI